MLTPYLLILTGLAVTINLIFTKKPRNLKTILEIFIRFYIFFNIGLGGLLAFYGHAFMADKIAVSIGWAPGSPFQFEVAVANLSFAVLGILSLWLSGDFWLATALGTATFGFGAAYGHLRDIYLHQNLAINNAGPVLWLNDLALPAVLLILVFIHRKISRKG